MECKDICKKMKAIEFLTLGIELLLSLWALTEGSLVVLDANLPLFEQITVYLEQFIGWDMRALVLALGLGYIFVTVHYENSNPWVNSISAFFAICTVLGKSYMEIDSWDYVFHSGLQFCLGILIFCGYFFIYTKCILFVNKILGHVPWLFRKETHGRLEAWFFEKHPFAGALAVIWIIALPWLILFFPGTLEADGCFQLLMSFGAAAMSGHHPVLVTKLMGICLHWGRLFWNSDNAGIFLYTFFQFVFQSLVMAYAIYVLTKMGTPILLRWAALIFYSAYPIFPMWGYTLVKDTGYYCFILLFVTTLIHILYVGKKNPAWWQIFLFAVAAIGLGTFRNDGRYVILLTCFWGVIFYRKYWKLLLFNGIICLMSIFLVEGVYMKMENIPQGSKREMMTIPLQQTARYVKEHYDELTPEETEILQSGFSVELSELANLYIPDFSDPIKGRFLISPDAGYLKEYFKVWGQQFIKHPDTYIQAFLNQIYGYFYPEKESSWEGIGILNIKNSLSSQDEFLNLSFGIENELGRNILGVFVKLIKVLPVIGLLFSPGIHTYILLGCITYLIAQKKKQKLIVYIPGLCVLMICMASPVTACIRYTLPNIVLLPMHLGWCYHVRH